METIATDYSPRGVQFYYIYKSLAHPETNGYITPFSLDERLMHVAEAKRTLGSQIEWICDTMENDLKHALGDRPNSEFIVDPDGQIVVARSWSDPQTLRADLGRLVGPVEHPTRIEDLEMKRPPAATEARSGVVERIRLPGQMSPLTVTPKASKVPFYAKLRVEIGDGKLYLAVFLDPLYKVHWNNQAPPLEYDIKTPPDVEIKPTAGKSPKPEVDADIDPREFLLEVSGRSREPLEVTVKYFACDDAETFCIPVTQSYLVTFERDRDGGNRRLPRSSVNRNPSNAAADRFRQLMKRVPVLAALDLDGDDKLSAAEIDAAPQSLQALDADGDGDLGAHEIRPSGSRTPNRAATR